MASIKVAYGTSTPFTITLASLSNSATSARESTAVDNSSDLFVDAMAQLKVTLSSGSPANDKAVYVYGYGSEDGTTYTDNATGTDAAVILRAPTAMRLIGVVPTPDAGSLTYESQPMSVAAAFGGVLPRKWGIVVRNYSGLALSASTSDNAASYTGVYYTSA